MTCNEKKTRNNKDYRENQSKVEMDRKKSLEMGPRTGKVKVVKVQVNNTVGRGLSRMGDRCVTVEPFQNRYKQLLRTKVRGTNGRILSWRWHCHIVSLVPN